MTTLDTVIQSSVERNRGNLMYAALRANKLYGVLAARKQIEFEDGGTEIKNPLIVGRNPNIASVRYYGKIPIGQTNEFLNIEYGFTRLIGTTIISQQEEDENRGETAVFKIASNKLKVLRESIQEKFGTMMHGAGLGDDILGLDALIPEDPTTGTVAGKSRAAHPELRTSSYAYAGAIQPSNIEEMLSDTMELDLQQRGDKVDLIIMGRNLYRIFRAAIRNKFTLDLGNSPNQGKRMVDLGFQGKYHMGVDIVYDEEMHPDKMYFINTKHLKMHVFKHVNFRVSKLTAPWNIQAKGTAIDWHGQMCLWNFFRKHAVVTNYGWTPASDSGMIGAS